VGADHVSVHEDESFVTSRLRTGVEGSALPTAVVDQTLERPVMGALAEIPCRSWVDRQVKTAYLNTLMNLLSVQNGKSGRTVDVILGCPARGGTMVASVLVRGGLASGQYAEHHKHLIVANGPGAAACG
jgi:hypothetical protein